MLGFALWCFIQAIFDTEGEGRAAKGIIARIGYAVVGVAYGALAFGAYQLVAGTGNGGKSSTTIPAIIAQIKALNRLTRGKS